ncbi:type 1 periplasmic binding fold superfamily protein [Pseudofulvibacter geojedonensis]|uniref:Type 1 periplasmic binding fold superfamily protein n=1 Tax=Pseudofulvibacter geojedonensis TaxID=1123758 RepID=A0ABW3HYB7_9FLAO
MKTIKTLLLGLAIAGFTACSSDDPDHVHQEEVITTMTITLSPQEGGTDVILKTQDLDGDGPNPPIITNGNLVAGKTYNGSIVFLNETESPADNITTEVSNEGTEHQVLFTAGGGLDVTTDYTDQDSNGNPIGLTFTVTANTSSTGTFTVTLKHEPTKPNDGTIAGAGGETDIDATFNVNIQS